MGIENDLKQLDVLQISVLFWRQRKLSDKEIGKKFGFGEDWVEARMGEIYKELGFDPKMHSSQKKRLLEKDYYPAVKLLTNDDPDTLPDWPLKAKPVDQNRPNPSLTPPPRRPTKTVDQPRPSPRSIWTWLWIPILLLFLGALYATYLFGRNSIPQAPSTSAATAISTNAQADTPQPSPVPIQTDTPQSTNTPTNTLTPIPVVPSATLTPVPTDTKSPLGLGKGDELQDDRVTLKLTDIKYNEKYDRIGARFAPVSYYFDFTNHSGETIVLQIDTTDFKITDNIGAEANCWFYNISGAGTKINEPLNNGDTRQIVARCGLGMLDPKVNTFTLTVLPFSSLPESTWIVQVPH